MVTVQIPRHHVSSSSRAFPGQRPLVSLKNESYVCFARAVEQARGRAVQFLPAPAGSRPANLNGFPAYVQTDDRGRDWYCVQGRTTENGRSIKFTLKLLTHKYEAFGREFLFGGYKTENQREYSNIIFYSSSGTNRGYDRGRWRITSLQVFVPGFMFKNTADVEELFPYILGNRNSKNREDKFERIKTEHEIYSFSQYKPVLDENGTLCLAMPTQRGTFLLYELFKPEQISLQTSWFMKENVAEDVLQQVIDQAITDYHIMKGDVLLDLNELLHAVANSNQNPAVTLDVGTLWRKGLLTVVPFQLELSLDYRVHHIFASSVFHSRIQLALEALGSFGRTE